MKIYIETMEGYEDIKPDTWYVDSDTGELHHKSGRILKGSWSRSRKYPYKQVTLQTARGKKIHKRKDRIIALALVDGRTAGRNEVDHINGKHDDDRPENLRWSTREENMIFQSFRARKQQTKKKGAKKKDGLPGQLSLFLIVNKGEAHDKSKRRNCDD